MAEFGKAKIKIIKDCVLFDGIDTSKLLNVWMSHDDFVVELPPGFETIATVAEDKEQSSNEYHKWNSTK